MTGKHFYSEMQAFSNDDKEFIKSRILDICGNERFFEESLESVGIRSNVGAWTLVFCLYLEVLSFLVAIPIGLIGVVAMLPVALIPCPYCRGDSEHDFKFQELYQVSPYTAGVIYRWFWCTLVLGLLVQGVMWICLSPLICLVLLIRYCSNKSIF